MNFGIVKYVRLPISIIKHVSQEFGSSSFGRPLAFLFIHLSSNPSEDWGLGIYSPSYQKRKTHFVTNLFFEIA